MRQFKTVPTSLKTVSAMYYFTITTGLVYSSLLAQNGVSGRTIPVVTDQPEVTTVFESSNPSEDYNTTSIAIGLGITTAKMDISFDNPTEDELLSFPFFRYLLPSICDTFTEDFTHNIYLAYDYTDQFFSKEANIALFRSIFFVPSPMARCFRAARISVYLVRCDYFGKPAWSQNDAMLAAYVHNNTYYYRVNDDTILVTPHWARHFTQALAGFQPPNVGVVGPFTQMADATNRGNAVILTYDFVHRTHLDVFGYYYPRVFEGWHADRWINDVYAPDRKLQLEQVHVEHIESNGRRYEKHELPSEHVQNVVEEERQKYLNRFLEEMSTRQSNPGNSTEAMNG